MQIILQIFQMVTWAHFLAINMNDIIENLHVFVLVCTVHTEMSYCSC